MLDAGEEYGLVAVVIVVVVGKRGGGRDVVLVHGHDGW
jgi:hypothetical protein